MRTLVLGLVAATLATSTSSQQTRPWYRGGLAPLLPAPVSRSCVIPDGKSPKEAVCDKGLRLVEIGVYDTWHCIALEELQNDKWIKSPTTNPTCYDTKPKPTPSPASEQPEPKSESFQFDQTVVKLLNTGIETSSSRVI